MASSPITAWQKGEKAEIVTNFLFLGSRITVDSDCNHEIRRQLLLSRKVTDKPRQCVEKQRHYSADKGPYSQSYGLSSGHVWLWELDHKEGWMLKNWYFWTVVLEKTLESPLDCKEIIPISSRVNQPWRFIRRADTLATLYEEPTH